MRPLLQAGPFKGVDLTSDPFYVEQGNGTKATNVDIMHQPEAMVTNQGRTYLGKSATFGLQLSIPQNMTINGMAEFRSFAGEAELGQNIGSLQVIVFSAIQPGTGISYQAYYNPNTGIQLQLNGMQPFTQAVQFSDTLYTNGGDRVIFLGDGSLTFDRWQISPGDLPATGGGFLSKLSYSISTARYANTLSGGNLSSPPFARASSQNYQYAITFRRAGTWTVTGSGPTSSGGNPIQGTFILQPDLQTYQESSPIIAARNVNPVAQGTTQPCLAVPATTAALADLVSGTTPGGETYYGALYRASDNQPTFVFVDYLINFFQGTSDTGFPCFEDTFGDGDIVNNVIMTLHNDVPPISGQTYPGPSLPSLNTQNGQPVQGFAQSQINQSFRYLNPSFITKHKNRMFAFTIYPTNPLKYQASGNAQYVNRTTLQPQLWFSAYGVGWAFDDVNLLTIVGPEDTAGNYAVDINLGGVMAPWTPNQVSDTPMGIASTGSILAIFKRQTTWILFGDSPAEWSSGLRRAFDWGCVSTNSITTAEGGVFWLSDNPVAVWFFDGASPSYISEDIRHDLELFPLTELKAAAGGYYDRRFYLSFAESTVPTSPAYQTGITYVYSTNKQKWYTLPYGGQYLFVPQFTEQAIVLAHMEPAGFEPAPITVDLWELHNAGQDLGQPLSATWVTEKTDSKIPGILKKYQYVTLTAPVQDAMATVTVTLDDDPSLVYSVTWDLSYGPYARTASLPANMIGYTAQMSIEVSNSIESTTPVVITSCVLVGDKHGGLLSTAAFDGSTNNVGPQ